MGESLRISTGLFLLLAVLLGNLKAMNVIETDKEVLIESRNKYPNKIFDSIYFINEINKIECLENKPTVEIDLSNDISVNLNDVRRTLNYLNRRAIKLNFLNISNTNIDEDVLLACEHLFSNNSFKHLDISGTLAAQNAKDLSKNEKIIFIEENLLHKIKKKLQKTFGKEVIFRHKRYYEKTKSFARAREEGKFEGSNLQRVTFLFPDKENELTDEAKEEFLNSSSLINLRKLNLKNQGIDDDFIKKLCKNITFSKVESIDLNDNEKVTEKSLKFISESKILGSVREHPQISSRYECHFSEIFINIKGTSIPHTILEKYQNEPQNKDFSIRFLSPVQDDTITEPVNKGIKWLRLV